MIHECLLRGIEALRLPRRRVHLQSPAAQMLCSAGVAVDPRRQARLGFWLKAWRMRAALTALPSTRVSKRAAMQACWRRRCTSGSCRTSWRWRGCAALTMQPAATACCRWRMAPAAARPPARCATARTWCRWAWPRCGWAWRRRCLPAALRCWRGRMRCRPPCFIRCVLRCSGVAAVVMRVPAGRKRCTDLVPIRLAAVWLGAAMLVLLPVPLLLVGCVCTAIRRLSQAQYVSDGVQP